MTALDDLAHTQGASVYKFQAAWIIDDDTLTTKQIMAAGRERLRDFSDVHEFVPLNPKFSIDGRFLRVTSDAFYWPTDQPVRVDLYDDEPSGVPES